MSLQVPSGRCRRGDLKKIREDKGIYHPACGFQRSAAPVALIVVVRLMTFYCDTLVILPLIQCKSPVDSSGWWEVVCPDVVAALVHPSAILNSFCILQST